LPVHTNEAESAEHASRPKMFGQKIVIAQAILQRQQHRLASK
jgi:hypothetical protein